MTFEKLSWMPVICRHPTPLSGSQRQWVEERSSNSEKDPCSVA